MKKKLALIKKEDSFTLTKNYFANLIIKSVARSVEMNKSCMGMSF